ncbi:MAG TPA: hypothetical protein PLA94_12135 [Myxococcota bacterium]|nr:hypothetical protein [Myxococcota bacterium]
MLSAAEAVLSRSGLRGPHRLDYLWWIVVFMLAFGLACGSDAPIFDGASKGFVPAEVDRISSLLSTPPESEQPAARRKKLKERAELLFYVKPNRADFDNFGPPWSPSEVVEVCFSSVGADCEKVIEVLHKRTGVPSEPLRTNPVVGLDGTRFWIEFFWPPESDECAIRVRHTLRP